MPLLVNRLRLTDILPYTLSFTNWKSRLEVFRGLAFEGTVYQRDFQQFLEHPMPPSGPRQRLSRAGRQYGYDYGGMDHSLAGLAVDWTHQQITFPPGMPEDQRRGMEAAIFSQPPQQRHMNRAFEVRWLGALVDLYRGSRDPHHRFPGAAQSRAAPGPARPSPLDHHR